MKHPGDRRHNCEQNEQIDKGLTGFHGPYGQRPDHTDAGIGQYPRHPKTKGHAQPSFIGHDVFHEFACGSKPAQSLRLDDGIGGRKLRVLAVGRHLLGLASPLGIDLDRAAHAFFGLCRHQLMVDAVPGHEFSMSAFFGNTALVQHQNAVGIDDAGEAMRKD